MDLTGRNAQEAANAGAGLGLLDLAERRLQWLGARQSVLAQNVANADTPGWTVQDVKPFAEMLKSSLGASIEGPSVGGAAGGLEETNPLHMPGAVSSGQGAALLRGESAPDGNQVSVDQQMERIAETDSQHEAVTAIYMKYLGMFRTAIGK
jgi:flagellar basal-body rod protein FlgB